MSSKFEDKERMGLWKAVSLNSWGARREKKIKEQMLLIILKIGFMISVVHMMLNIGTSPSMICAINCLLVTLWKNMTNL